MSACNKPVALDTADMVPFCVSLCPQVDAGRSGDVDPDCDFQLQRSVFLLLRHRLLRTLATDIPSQRPGLSLHTGTRSSQKIPDSFRRSPASSHAVLVNVLMFSAPERFGSLHHVDIHRLSDQLFLGSSPVGRGQQHGSQRLAVHPVCGGGGMVSVCATVWTITQMVLCLTESEYC